MNKIILTFGFIFLVGFTSLSAAKAKSKEVITDENVERQHTLVIAGNTVPYTSRTGTLVIKGEDSKEKANVFFVAYTRDDVKDLGARPLIFCFNGGPGSCSVWLHLGAFGPKTVFFQNELDLNSPYTFEDNPYSLIDVADLVFIDPVSTGHSVSAPGEDPKQFHGVDEDIALVGEFIRLYTTRYNRWDSPIYLAGESYGTTRAAGLSEYLQDKYRLYLDGIIFISTALNFQTLLDYNRGNDLPYILFLPSYSVAAWYHGKLPSDLQQVRMEEVVRQSRAFAEGEYASALLKGDRLTSKEKESAVTSLSRFTGLSPEYLQSSNLRVPIHRFNKELLRSEGKTLGRMDSRIVGPDLDRCSDSIEYDPALEPMLFSYSASFNAYLRRDLGWEKDQHYVILASMRDWNYAGRASNNYLNVGETLRKVMLRSSGLRVFVANGYSDLATPFFATEYTFDHFGFGDSERSRVLMKNYEGGHMMYTHRPSLVKLSEDIKAFIR